MRAELLAALAAALAAGCRRAPPPVAPAAGAPAGVTLDAPAPSSTVVTSPLGSGASAYTNEMQVQNLRDQAAILGISRLAKPSAAGLEPDEAPRALTYQEGVARTRALTREIEAERRAIDSGKAKPVAIPTGVPGLLPGDREGAPVESPAGDDGSKDLETK